MNAHSQTQDIAIKCLKLQDSLGMPGLMERLFWVPRLVHVQGTESVGKTAFCFKVALQVIDLYPGTRVLWMYFDDEIDYWKSAFETIKPSAPVSYLSITTKSTAHFFRQLARAMEGNPYKLIVVDGLQYANLHLAGRRRVDWLSLLCVKSERYGIPILLTDRRAVPKNPWKDPEILQPIYTHSEQWSLARPAFRIDALGEGDTFVTMLKAPNWPGPILGEKS